MKIQAYNKMQLAKLYGVSYETFKRWLSKVPELGLEKTSRTLTPKQVEKIVSYLGSPD
ncbi:MAG: DUF4248 domain-containing protein [Chitinophagales bacterium]